MYMYVRMYACMCVDGCVDVFLYMCVCLYIYICVFVCVYVCVPMCVYVHMCTSV